MSSEPIRTCAGCGRRAPKAGLIRFIARTGALTPSPYFHLGGNEVKSLTPDHYTRFVERVQDTSSN